MYLFFFFFFKQKTAYEMRISDWSSDVCSSDLLSLLGILTVHNFDTAHMTASMSAALPGDVLLVFSEHGKQPALCQLGRYFRGHGGRVISVTRHTSNALRAHADVSLLVSAHEIGRAHV